MSETVARNKYSCPSCGAEATWNPVKNALVCGFCSMVSPANLTLSATGEAIIVEHDLASALREIPDSARGWQAEKTQVRCQSCDAISVFDPSHVGQRCDFCGSASLLPYEEIKQPFRPESVLEFKVSESQVRDTIRKWYGSHWFAPGALGQEAMTDTVKGLYIPYWTFDAQTRANWTAETNHPNANTETLSDQANGKTRQVQKTRWRTLTGTIDRFFDDQLVAASKGVDDELLTEVEPFPTKELKPYHPGYLSGWVVERYQIDLMAAAIAARKKMEVALQVQCAKQLPRDSYRNMNVKVEYSAQTFKHILVPIWLLVYDFHGKPYQVVINGYTGAISGHYPKSWIKVTLATIAGLIVLAAYLWVKQFLS